MSAAGACQARVLAGIFTALLPGRSKTLPTLPHSLLSSPTLTLGNTWTKHRYGYQIINMCFAPRKIFFGPFLQSYFYFSRTTISIKIMGNNWQTIIRALPHLTLHTGVIISIMLTDIRQCNLTSGRAGGGHPAARLLPQLSRHIDRFYIREQNSQHLLLLSDPHVRWCTVNW